MDKQKLKEPSELFEGIVMDGGTLVCRCELCGRTHFASSDELGWEDGEYDRFREKSKQHPDRYIETTGSVHIGEIDNRVVVIGCPCNGLRKFEDFIWSEQHIILEYLKRRFKEDKEIADERLNKLRGVVNNG